MNINNISPNIWGKHGWKFLHYITFTYPEKPTNEEKEIYKTFFTHVGKVLPCFSCKNNYNNHLTKFPLNDDTLKSKKTLVKWLVNIHNEVNLATGKPILPLEKVLEIYLKPQNNYLINYMPKTQTLYIFFIIILLVVLIFLIKKRKNTYNDFISKINIIN